MERIVGSAPLGNRASWGKVGYVGAAFAPAPGTYPGADPMAAYTSTADSGDVLRIGAGLANLAPLVAAAFYETGFAWEAGPLSTWRN